MPPIDDTTTDETTTSETADEAAENASPVDGGEPSSATSETEETEELDLSPEAVAEREKAARNAARMKAADEADKRAATARAKRQKEREEAERSERVAAKERAADNVMREAQGLLSELRATKERVLRGGKDALKALGVEYGEWTKATLEETSPDALAQQAIARSERLEAELARRDREAEQRAAATKHAENRKSFEGFIETNAEDFPEAAKLTTRMTHILAGEEADAYYRETGAWPSFETLSHRLDKAAKKFHDEQQTKSARRTRSDDSPGDGATNRPINPPGLPANAPANRTLTGALAGTRAKPPRQMTDEEVDEWSRAELRTALAADRKAAQSA